MPHANIEDRRAYHRAYEKRAQFKRWRANYQAKHGPEIAARKAAYYRANRDKFLLIEADRAYRKRYGITLEDYERMLREQGGRCRICRADKQGKKADRRFHVDHDHGTGKVRGLLCTRCNVSLGWYEQWKKQALQYLRENT